MFNANPSNLLTLYEHLLSMFGRQAWWPAESPFEVMVGAILTQNTSWSNVEKALVNLKQQSSLTAPRLVSLATADLENYLKPTGYFRIKTQRLQSYCHWYLSLGAYAGLQALSTRQLRASLLNVHGIGPETADDILLYAFNRPVFVIDTYTRRLLQYFQFIQGKEKYEQLRSLFEENLPKSVDLYQQYHALIVMHAQRQCQKNKLDCRICYLVKMDIDEKNKFLLNQEAYSVS